MVSALPCMWSSVGMETAMRSSMFLQSWWWSKSLSKVLRPVAKWFGTRADGVHEVGFHRLRRQLRISWMG